MNTSGGETILCISTRVQGQALLSELARLDCRTVLLTLEEHRDSDWPREILADLQTMPGGMSLEQIINTVAYLARSHAFARILPLDGAGMEMAAVLREHLWIPGMGVTTTHSLRDRLSMRIKAAQLKMRVPAFVPVVNYDAIRAFLEKTPAPWRLTPRSGPIPDETSEFYEMEQIWHTLEKLGDRQSYFLLEEAIAGDVFYVDSISSAGRVVFDAVEPYGDLFGNSSHHVDGPSAALSPECAAVMENDLKLGNSKLLEKLGLVRGIARSKFMCSHSTGEFHYMETSASVEDVSAVEIVEQAQGLNLWKEWARLEVAAMHGHAYVLPKRPSPRKSTPAEDPSSSIQ